MMSGGGMGGGPMTDLGALTWFLPVWVLMMAAMMVPSTAPMAVAFERTRRLRGGPAGGVGLFTAGYLLTWTAYGLAAYVLLRLLRDGPASGLSWEHGGRIVAAGIIAAAAVYQLTPLKQVCLGRCRSPLEFVGSGWRDGPSGAVRLGVAHGAWCAGCCWALMATLFALGVMSIGWMVLIAAIVAGEKLLPSGRLATLGVGVLLAVLAGLMLASVIP